MSEILNSELHRETIRLHLNRSIDKLHEEPNCEFWGEGINRGVIKRGSVAQFFVKSKTPDLLLLGIDVMDPDRETVDLGFHCLEENMHLVSFNVDKAGNYVVDVKWEGKPLIGSPFNVIASEDGKE